MIGVMIRSTVLGFVVMVPVLAGLTDKGLAADGRGHASKAEVHIASRVSEPDLDGLRSRLRATEAIGFAAKIALAFRFNDLVEDFRRFHAGLRQHSLDNLRGRFADLFDETVRRVREGDYALFRELQKARAGLWQTFRDPVKFAALAGDKATSQIVKPGSR